jgi:hypothetical protein
VSDIERRLQEAVRARMDSVPDIDEEAALAEIRSELGSGRSRRPIVLGAIAAAVLLIAVVAVVLTRSDDTTTVVTPATESSTSSSPFTTVQPTAPEFAGLPVWPFAASGQTFDSPEAVAKDFAVKYLDIAAPSVEPNGAAVTVRVNGKGAPVIVDTRETSAGWVVIGAHSDQIVFEGLADGDPAPSTVKGMSSAFEALILIDVRPFGSTQEVERARAMGSGSMELGPFQTTLQNTAAAVLVAYAPDASGEGTMSYATVIRVRSAEALDASAFNGKIVGTNTSGQAVEVTSASGASATGGEPTSSAGGLTATVEGANVVLSSAGVVVGSVGPGSKPTFRSLTDLAYVDPDGLTVWSVDVFKGTAKALFKAQHKITSIDGNVVGGLIFTDDQTGLWRWDGDSNTSGPVKMTDGYVSATW